MKAIIQVHYRAVRSQQYEFRERLLRRWTDPGDATQGRRHQCATTRAHTGHPGIQAQSPQKV